MSKGSTKNPKAKGLSLRDVAVFIFRYRLMIFLTFLTTAGVAAGLAFYLPNQYESRMKILVKNVRVETPVSPDKTGVVADPNEVPEAQMVAQTELLKSRDLLEQVVVSNKLAIAENGGSPTPQEIEQAVYKLEKDLKVNPVKKANLIEVTYVSTSPETAAAVLNQLAQLYLDKHIKIHRTPGTFDFFKNQTEQTKSELREAENRLQQFQKQNEVVSITQQKDLGLNKFIETQARLSDLNGAIRETDRRIAELEKQLGSMENRISTQTRVMPNQDSVERFKTMLVELRNRRTQLLTKFQPEDRMVKEVDEQIRTTTEALNRATETTYREQSTDINPLRQALESELAKAKVEQTGRIALKANLENQVRQYQAELDKLKSATSAHDDLSREVQKNNESYRLYAQKQEESRISDELDKQKISNVSIAEAAAVPRVPNKTNRPLTIVLGLAMGLVLGVGCAIAREFFRETIHTPAELEAFTGLPVIATVPLNSTQMRRLTFRMRAVTPEVYEAPAEDPVIIDTSAAEARPTEYVRRPKTGRQAIYSKF